MPAITIEAVMLHPTVDIRAGPFVYRIQTVYQALTSGFKVVFKTGQPLAVGRSSYSGRRMGPVIDSSSTPHFSLILSKEKTPQPLHPTSPTLVQCNL